MNRIKKELLNGTAKIGVFGTGYIGLNTMIYYAARGVYSVGVDIDQKKVDTINNGVVPMPELVRWFGFDTKPLMNEFIKATTDWKKALRDPSISVFFIAVPTERGSEPWFEPLIDVIGKIAERTDNSLVIIESTVSPGTIDRYVRPKLRDVVIAPRRDWLGFEDNTKNLKNLPRIVGGTTPEVTQKAIEVLSIVCDHLLPCSYKEAEIVKAIENSIRHVLAVYAQELTLAYPNIDIRKALKLAGTKWNIPEMYPDLLGCGGYCIPLSTRYILSGAERPEYLRIAERVLHRDDTVAQEIARLVNSKDVKNVGILGLCYLGNIKVHILSGCLRLLQFIEDKTKTYVNDPLYTSDEIDRITDCDTFIFPDELDRFDMIIVASGHDIYKHVSRNLLVEKTKDCKLIIDNTGIWSEIPFKCPYYLAGSQPGIF